MKKILLGTIIAAMLLGACNRDPKWVKNFQSGEALGTSYHITYFHGEELDLQVQIDSVFDAVNRSMSTYIPDSDISKVNRGDSTLQVDTMFKDVFLLSSEIHKNTFGYFDPTVGTLVNAWGFGPGKQLELDSLKVDSLMRYVGFGKVSMSDDNRIIKDDPNIYFDFNAIAKGYAIDRLAAMMDAQGITDYLLEVGGEIVGKGMNLLKDKEWVVGIDDPQGVDRSVPKLLINLRDIAMASSGNYRKFRIDSVTGTKYVHTINAKTGYTKNSNILAASVIADNCAKADAYATALMAMELEDSKSVLAAQQDLEAYIIYVDTAGETQQFMTEGFKKRVIKDSSGPAE
ncbi:MAG: FAD:protein FMN transferase [Sediminicola sp.]|tara:strand:+ start:56133 stop:57164 length:1032 start_codon:yes stop_codon:yes gene_type:complete